MEIALYIHGVPNGASFWGKEDGRQYFESFYQTDNDDIKLLVQTRMLNGKPYSCYNYLVYKNVVGKDGRMGSYFGMSLRIEEKYCKDVLSLYRILDIVYHFHILGHFLKQDNGMLRYDISDFPSVSTKIKEIDDVITSLLRQTAISSNDFVSLNSFNTIGGQTLKKNLYDCTNENAMAAVKQYGSIAISPYYPREKEISIEERHKRELEEEQKRFDKRIREQEASFEGEKKRLLDSQTSLKNEVQRLQNENSKKDDKINAKDGEISDLKKRLRQNEQSRKVSLLVESIKEPVTELNGILREITPPYSRESQNSRKNKRKPPFPPQPPTLLEWVKVRVSALLFIAFGILLVLGLGYAALKIFGSPENNLQQKPVQEKVDRQQKPVYQDVPQADAATDIDISKVRIDIKHYNGGPLKLNKPYDVEAINGVAKGGWRIEGGDIFPNEENPQKAQIIPKEKKVKITYVVGDKKKERELEAK